MYTESDLEAAVSAGALKAADARRLRDYLAAERAAPAADEEHFRLITGFNDIFVSIAAVILLVAVGWIGNELPPHIEFGGPSPFAGVAVAAASWGLAEFFTRQRRMALPSILLLLAFVGGVTFASGLGLAIAIGTDAIDNNERLAGVIMAVTGLIGAGAAWLHWRRFRVPITVAAGAASLVGLGLGTLGVIVGDVEGIDDIMLAFALLLGVGVFLFAMWWDASDPRRETRRSDVAFWLHLLAAPLIVHPVFVLLGLTDGEATPLQALSVVVLYVVLGLTALAIDRRALLVSALVYVLYALNSLFREYGNVEMSFALTALVIGSGLLLLSAFWQTARRAVVAPLPETLRARLPVVDRLPRAQPAS